MPPTNLFGLGYGVGPAGYGYPSVGRWSPLSLGASLAAWYKADGVLWQDAARTVRVTADGDPVGAWDDASGNGRHRIQTNNAARPTWIANGVNGRPVVRGSATSYWENVTIPTDGVGLVTLHASKYVAAVGAYHMFYETLTTDPMLRIDTSDKVEVDMGAGTPATSPLSYAGAWSVISAVHGRSTPRICRVNGAQRASDATAMVVPASCDMNTWSRAGSFCLQADVHEEIFVGADMADAVLTQAESYLNAKVGAY